MALDDVRRVAGPFTCTGGETLIPYDFRLVAAADIAVWRRRGGGDELLQLGLHYTLSGVGSDNGGDIVLAEGALAGDVYVGEGDRPHARTSNLAYSRSLPAGTVNAELDSLQIQIAELSARLDRAVARSKFDAPDLPALELPPIEPDKFLGTDDDGMLVFREGGSGGGGGSIPDPLPVAKGGTGANDALTARDNLGLGDLAIRDKALRSDLATGTISVPIEDRVHNSPPVAAPAGAAYIMGPGPLTGAWSARTVNRDIAISDGIGGWAFSVPGAGWQAEDKGAGALLHFTGSGVWETVLDAGDLVDGVMRTAVFEYQAANGANGGTPTLNAWTDMPVNTVVSNSIVGLSYAPSAFTFPEGLFEVSVVAKFSTTGTAGSGGKLSAQQRLLAGTAVLAEANLYGVSQESGASASGSGLTFSADTTVIARDTFVVEVQTGGTLRWQYVTNAGSLGAPSAEPAGAIEVFRRVTIRELKAQRGLQGIQGLQGNPGSDAVYVALVHSTATSGDPGAGKSLFNNATFADATAWHVSETDANAASIAAAIASWGNSTSSVKARVRLSKTGAAQNFFEFLVTGAGTDHGTWWSFPIAPVAAPGTIANGNAIGAVVLDRGDKGDAGAGAPGPPGPAGPNTGLDFAWNTATAGDPGTGRVLANDVVLADATAVHISKVGRTGEPLGAYLATWDGSNSAIKGHLRLFTLADREEFIEASVIGIADLSSYYAVTIDVEAAAGVPDLDDIMSVSFVRTGDKGDIGSGLPVATSRAALAAIAVSNPVAYLNDGARSGLFRCMLVSGLSSEEASGFAVDVEEGVFVVSTDDASYVWVRNYEQLVPRFFGANPYPVGNPPANVVAIQAAVDFAMACDDPLVFDDLYETDGTVDLTGRVNVDGAGNRTGLCFEGAVVGMEIKVAANRPGGSSAIFQGGSIKNIGFWSLDGAAGSEGVRISGNNGVYMTFWDIDVWGHGVEIVIHHTRTTNIGAPFYVIPGSDCNFTAHALPNDQFNGGGGYTTYPSRAIKFDAGCAAHQILQVPHAHIANGGIVIEMGDGTGGLGDLLVMPGHWLCPTGSGTGVKITGPSDLSRYREHMSFMGLDFDGGIATAFDLTRVKKFTIDESCTWGYGVVNALNACTEYTMHRNSFRQEHGRQILVLGSGSQTLTLATLASAISAQYGGGYVEAICNGFVAGVGAFSGTIRARWVWNNGTLSLTAESVTMVGTTPPTLAITASTNSIVVTLLMAPSGANSQVHFQLNTYGPAIAVALTSNAGTTE